MTTDVERATAEGLSVGVEEEFLLVEPVRGVPVPAAAAVLGRAGRVIGPEVAALHPELFACQVEAATAPCTTLDRLTARLRQGRAALVQAARAEGTLLVSSGVPVVTGGPPPITPGGRFARIRDLYGGVMADYQACGCHVHVGVPDRETAVAVMAHVRPWLPTLLALGGNSAWHAGVDTGYRSWRMVQQSRFPGSGLPPRFRGADEYDAAVERLVAAGVLVDDTMSFWLVRPSRRLPTLEFRVADAALSVDEAVLQAALCRALVRTALAELARGREAGCPDQVLGAPAVWSAARYGARGPGVDLRTGRPSPARRLVYELLDLVTPALEDTGDLTTVRRTLSAVLAGGTGADVQRAAAAGGAPGIVRAVAQRTADMTDRTTGTETG